MDEDEILKTAISRSKPLRSSARNGKDLRPYSRSLERLAVRLRFLGLGLATGTLLGMLFCPIVIRSPKSFSENENFLLWMWLLGINLFVAIIFDVSRRKGASVFEEISDEFQWSLSSRKVVTKELGVARQPLELRMATRSFLVASELPLAPGRFGPTIYALFNIGLLAAGLAATW